MTLRHVKRRDKGIPQFDEMLSFSACDLWPLIKDKTLWIMGDSHSYDLFHAVACLLLPVRAPLNQQFPMVAFYSPQQNADVRP